MQLVSHVLTSLTCAKHPIEAHCNWTHYCETSPTRGGWGLCLGLVHWSRLSRSNFPRCIDILFHLDPINIRIEWLQRMRAIHQMHII